MVRKRITSAAEAAAKANSEHDKAVAKIKEELAEKTRALDAEKAAKDAIKLAAGKLNDCEDKQKSWELLKRMHADLTHHMQRARLNRAVMQRASSDQKSSKEKL